MRRILSRLRHRPRQEGVRTLLWAKALQYRLLSDHQHVFTDASTNGAVLAIGNGTISVRGATLGYWPSPGPSTGTYTSRRGRPRAA